jgi:hypothetical protein
MDSLVSFDSFFQVFRHLLGPRSLYSLERPLTHKQISLLITLNGIKLIPTTTIVLAAYLGSKLGPCNIVVTYEIRVFFEGAQKEVFSSILKFENVNT